MSIITLNSQTQISSARPGSLPDWNVECRQPEDSGFFGYPTPHRGIAIHRLPIWLPEQKHQGWDEWGAEGKTYPAEIDFLQFLRISFRSYCQQNIERHGGDLKNRVSLSPKFLESSQ